MFIFIQKYKHKNYTISCLITSLLYNANKIEWELQTAYGRVVLNERCVINQQGLSTLKCYVFFWRKKHINVLTAASEFFFRSACLLV